MAFNSPLAYGKNSSFELCYIDFKGGILKILLFGKRASDGLIKETNAECTSVEDFSEGVDIFLNNKSFLGYCIKDAETGEILVKKGDI